MSSEPERTLEVVFVCTGNRARSPLAEALFRRYSTSAGVQVQVASFGTMEVGPLPPLPLAVESGRELGVDLTGHRARAFRRGDLASTDLVLGFEPFHVFSAVIDGSAHPGRAFLLGEFAVLLETHGAEATDVRARGLIAAVDSRRVRSRPDPSAQVVADPLGKPVEVMARTATEIDRLVRRLAVVLAPPDEKHVDVRPPHS